MWAMVKSGQVTAIYPRPKAITVDGIQHPATIFGRWSAAELKAIGIYEYTEVNANPDGRFYMQGNGSTAVDDDKGIVTVTYSNVARGLNDVTEDGITTPGVKSNLKRNVKLQAASQLQSSDWMAIRAAEGGTAVPSDIKTYRAAVRTKSNSMETSITDASDTAALIALDTTTYHANGAINAVATLQDWPEVPDALK